MVERNPLNPVIEGMLAEADAVYQDWSLSLPVIYREHDRPFYQTPDKPGAILCGLRIFHDQDCDEWIKLKLKEKGSISILDLCCGTGRAARQIEQQNPGVISFGLTGNTFFHPSNGESAMQLPKDRLVIGNAAHLGKLMDTRMKGKKFDVIYSFQGLSYIPLPFLYMISQIYPLLEDGGVAFLEHRRTGCYGEIEGLYRFKDWLKKNGYDFEFNEGMGRNRFLVNIPRSAFRKTNPQLQFPIEYTPEGLSVFRNVSCVP